MLIRFRSYPVAIAGDISKLYRAVQLTLGNRDFHRFLWRPNLTSAIQDYRMKYVTFGVASSPYLATQVLQQTALDFGNEFTLAKPHIFSSFYVDDCLAGADSPDNAIKLQQQQRNLLQKEGFDLRMWKSNSQIVLDSIQAMLHDPAQVKVLTEGLSNAPQKTFGIVWNASNDCHFVSIGNHSTAAPTSWSIISDVARAFYVLGWLTPS